MQPISKSLRQLLHFPRIRVMHIAPPTHAPSSLFSSPSSFSTRRKIPYEESNWKRERKNETGDDDISYSRNLRVKLRMHVRYRTLYPRYTYF